MERKGGFITIRRKQTTKGNNRLESTKLARQIIPTHLQIEERWENLKRRRVRTAQPQQQTSLYRAAPYRAPLACLAGWGERWRWRSEPITFKLRLRNGLWGPLWEIGFRNFVYFHVVIEFWQKHQCWLWNKCETKVMECKSIVQTFGSFQSVTQGLIGLTNTFYHSKEDKILHVLR